MRVRMLRNSATPLRRGVVYDLPEVEAQRLLGLSAAEEEAEQPAEDKPEPDAKAVRAWAAEHDIDVPARGKLSAEVVEAYKAAHSEG